MSKLAVFRRGWVTFSQDFRGKGSSPCQYIDATRKAIDCATTLLLTVFGRPFVKRFALCYQTVVCLSRLSVCPVCNVRALWLNGCTDQNETWYAGRPWPWPHCVRWGPSSFSPKGHSPPIFDPYLLRPNGCMGQDVNWYRARPRHRRLCVRWGPSPSTKRGRSPLPNFRPISIVAKRLDASKCHLVWM